MEIIRINRLSKPMPSFYVGWELIAFFDVKIERIQVNGVRLYREEKDNKERFSFEMPSKKGSDGTWRPVVILHDEEMSRKLLGLLKESYCQEDNVNLAESDEILEFFSNDESRAEYKLNFNENERVLINGHYTRLKDLEASMVAHNDEDAHFLSVCFKKAEAKTDIEKVYLRFKEFKRSVEEKYSRIAQMNKLEEGVPKLGWFTDDAWYALRRGNYRDMKSRQRGD